MECDPVSANCASREYAALLENGKFSDITIVVDGKEFKAHKNILASRSPVFAFMFEKNFKKPDSRMIIKDVSAAEFKEMLRFMYTFKTDALDRMAKGLRAAAEKVCIL